MWNIIGGPQKLTNFILKFYLHLPKENKERKPCHGTIHLTHCPNPVATGALVGLAPPNKATGPPKLKHEALYISGVFSNLKMSIPPQKRKAPLLKTFWRRFCHCLRASAYH